MCKMDKPAKSRRRRSIRNLRASTGFHSPSQSCAPYGSAWIDQDLETNMDNLVLSLSQLQRNDDDNDSGETNIPAKYKNSSTSISPSSENFFHGIVDKNTSLSASGDCAMQDGAPLTKLDSHPPRPYESFSFSPDMPLGLSSPPEECHFDSSIANVAQSTPSQFSVCRRLKRNLELSNQEEELRDEENEPDIHQKNEHPKCESLDYLELKQAYADLSLNFSPVPEQDETINFLVKSLHDNFDFSLSPQGVRPGTPDLSPLIPFNTVDAARHISVPESLHHVSPANEISSSRPHSEFLDATYTLISTVKEHPAGRNDSQNADIIINRNINSTSEPLSNIDNETCIGDKSRDFCQPHSIEKMTSIQALESNYFNMKTGNICKDVRESQCDDADCFSKFVDDMVSELERTVSKNATFVEIVNEDISAVPCTNVQDPPALKQHDELCPENAVKCKSMKEQQKTRSKRRSSRQFSIQEFLDAFVEPVKDSDSVINSSSVGQDIGLNLHFPGDLESEKENVSTCDRYLNATSDSNVPFGELINAPAQSDLNQNQNDSGKKKRGRRSGSFSKGKTKITSLKNTVKLSSNDSVALTPLNENCIKIYTVDDPTSKSNQTSHSITEGRDETEFTESGSGVELTVLAEDDDQQNESSSSVRVSRARRNRKSWGDVSSQRVAAVRQKRVRCEEKQPEVEMCNDDDSHLEQIYSKQKYVPVKPQSLETIKETPKTDMFFGKQKMKRHINFPEDYQPTVAKLRLRRKRTMKHSKNCLAHTPLDYDEFLIRLNAIQLDLESHE